MEKKKQAFIPKISSCRKQSCQKLMSFTHFLQAALEFYRCSTIPVLSYIQPDNREISFTKEADKKLLPWSPEAPGPPTTLLISLPTDPKERRVSEGEYSVFTSFLYTHLFRSKAFK